MSPEDALTRQFGYPVFREGQREVIDSLLAGRPALAVFPTGGGKSLCYQLPAVLLEGLTLVVSPLIALMKDQVDALQLRGIAAERLDSSLSAEEAFAVYDRIERKELKLLYVAPERLANENFRARLRGVRISLLAVDEAHCISEWGHNFRPDYLKLGQFANELKVERILALTATATPKVAADIRENFGIAENDHVQLSFHRANLRLRVTPCLESEKRALVLDRLRKDAEAPTIVYVTRQESVESLAAFLKREGLAARPYHAGLRDETRTDCQEAFMNGEAPIITATIAFGMGIDKADIRRVIHFNLPKSLENYTQETGRSGRDGLESTCELFACADDMRTLENFVYGDTPSPDAVRKVLDQILNRGEEFDLSHYELGGTHDIRPLVINTLLTYLELEGFIEATSPFFTTYKVKFLRDPEMVLHGFDSRRRDFLRRLFESGKEGRVWTTIDVSSAQADLECDRTEIVKVLADLETHGDVVLQPSGVRHGYRRLRKPDSLRELTESMQGLFLRREQQDIRRLEQVVEFAEGGACRNRMLLAHFGEELDSNCGHCDACESGVFESRTLPASPPPEIGLAEAGAIQALLEEKNGPLRTPRQLARFLCGLSSPAASRARLTRHDCFGLLEQHPFADVLCYCESLIFP